MTTLPITTWFAALFGIAFVPLSLQVALLRMRARVAFGDGGNPTLARRRAAQANFAQYVPFALLLMALCELGGAPGWLVLSLGGTLALGRILHAYSMLTTGLGKTRVAGMVFTFTAFLLGSGWLLRVSILA